MTAHNPWHRLAEGIEIALFVNGVEVLLEPELYTHTSITLTNGFESIRMVCPNDEVEADPKRWGRLLVTAWRYAPSEQQTAQNDGWHAEFVSENV